ncbi:STAS domain-containing protein [Streptomyces sp. NPDC006463]|uniref:STAS domain-containing protein n=1 Tax=Streptomyces sp. NPDC006463 TaxID=3364746 RepID=UPI003688E07F
MITTNVQRHDAVLVSVTGPLDESAGPGLQRALADVTVGQRDLMVALHRAEFMDVDGLLHLLALHRRAESLGLRVLVVGWQPQPQQLRPMSRASAGATRPPASGTPRRASGG